MMTGREGSVSLGVAVRVLFMFAEITSLKNLERAYLKLSEQMEGDGRSSRYAGWDGLKLHDLELNSAQIIKEARREMLSFKEVAPATLFKIPKKNNPQKVREIFIYNLKDRIKAQAIYQVVEPFFDRYFSPWLFSYRSSHPSYFAARSAIRHYKKYYARDFVLVADVSDYTGNIRADILLQKIARIGFTESVMKLFALFIENKALRAGEIVRPAVGLIAGTPLIALFYNIYLDDFDKYCGPRSDFYRRVGDDLIIFDKTKDRIASLHSRLLAETASLGVSLHEKKTKFISARDRFEYLGYSFTAGRIGLSRSFIGHTVKRWQQRFNFYRSRDNRQKKDFLRRALTDDVNSLSGDFKQLAEQKKLVTDSQQIRELSESFFRILTKYFFGNYSEKNRRLLKTKLRGLPLKSIYKYFLICQYGHHKRTN